MVAAQVAEKLSLSSSALLALAAAPTIRQMLTVEEFAACIDRSTEFVRRKIRGQVIPAKDVSGPPYLIHPRALLIFRVTPEIASVRLADLAQKSANSPVQIPASTPQLSPV